MIQYVAVDYLKMIAQFSNQDLFPETTKDSNIGKGSLK
jgi:hypothetical protein